LLGYQGILGIKVDCVVNKEILLVHKEYHSLVSPGLR
jgi:hypothetical protein